MLQQFLHRACLEVERVNRLVDPRVGRWADLTVDRWVDQRGVLTVGRWADLTVDR